MSEQTLEVKFKINDECVTLSVLVDGSDHLFKITNDNEYSIHYLTELINNGFISLKEPLQIIKRIEDDGSEIPIYVTDNENEENQEVMNSNTPNNEWNNYDTIKMLDLYEQYLPLVGPLKKFKTKKVMWNKIAEVLNSTYHTTRTGIQVENRYKTVVKRKKTAVENNNTSGATRLDIPFENELKKIASMDDSIEPEVTGTARGITIRKTRVLSDDFMNKPSTSSDQSSTPSDKSPNILAPPRRRVKSIQETLLEIHDKKEESKERRHKEKMYLLKKLLSHNNDSQ